MICYVDIEHEKALQGPEERTAHRDRCEDVRLRLEETSGDICLVRRHERVTQRWLRESKVKAVVISGNVTDWAEYDEADLLRLSRMIRDAELPIIGLCGGCQLIAMAHGAPLGSIRRIEKGEEDPCRDYAPGYFKEWGFVPMRILESDPIFDGLGERPCFLAAHYWEVKDTPAGFKLLASSSSCRVQAIKRIGKPVYGTQFHPEAYTGGGGARRGWLIDLVYPEGYPEAQTDGRKLLVNFFRMCGILE